MSDKDNAPTEDEALRWQISGKAFGFEEAARMVHGHARTAFSQRNDDLANNLRDIAEELTRTAKTLREKLP